MIRVGNLTIFSLVVIVGMSCTNADDLCTEPNETFGARADSNGPIGGGVGYKRLVTKATYLVKSRDELLSALKKSKSGEVVYVVDGAKIDLTFFSKIEIPEGVTLASGRGRDGSSGGLIYTTQERTFCMFKTGGGGVRVTGLRLRGPEPNRKIKELNELARKDPHAYKNYPSSRGIWVLDRDCEIDNCELWAWSAAAIAIWPGGSDCYIHHNYIHHCQRQGLGYGVAVSLKPKEVATVIERNVFDWCRHCIASPGFEGCSYEAHNNIVLGNSSSHSFDMHGQRDAKRDMFIAGTSINIHHNTFKAIKYPAIMIRGCPTKQALIHHNVLEHITPDYGVIQRDCVGNMRILRNVFGPDKTLVK